MNQPRGFGDALEWLAMRRETCTVSFADSADELNNASANAKLMVGIKALIAEAETDNMSARQYAAKRHAAEAGFNHGGTVPFGCILGPKSVDGLGRSGTRLLPHPVESRPEGRGSTWRSAVSSPRSLGTGRTGRSPPRPANRSTSRPSFGRSAPPASRLPDAACARTPARREAQPHELHRARLHRGAGALRMSRLSIRRPGETAPART